MVISLPRMSSDDCGGARCFLFVLVYENIQYLFFVFCLFLGGHACVFLHVVACVFVIFTLHDGYNIVMCVC